MLLLKQKLIESSLLEEKKSESEPQYFISVIKQPGRLPYYYKVLLRSLKAFTFIINPALKVFFFCFLPHFQPIDL